MCLWPYNIHQHKYIDIGNSVVTCIEKWRVGLPACLVSKTARICNARGRCIEEREWMWMEYVLDYVLLSAYLTDAVQLNISVLGIRAFINFDILLVVCCGSTCWLKINTYRWKLKGRLEGYCLAIWTPTIFFIVSPLQFRK